MVNLCIGTAKGAAIAAILTGCRVLHIVYLGFSPSLTIMSSTHELIFDTIRAQIITELSCCAAEI